LCPIANQTALLKDLVRRARGFLASPPSAKARPIWSRNLVPDLVLIMLLAGSLLGGAENGRDRPAACPGSAESSCRGAPVIAVAAPASSSVWKFTRTQGTKDGESFAAIKKHVTEHNELEPFIER
ncbi:MAG: hypothetical protein IIY36_01200, partial [Lachnospiraceae bacterium]|nr:hypothetical protein [Lachnospiraceae bacterium]